MRHEHEPRVAGDAVETGTAPDDAPSGAFVARIWHDPAGLRARIRHRCDLLDDRGTEQVATLRGPVDDVIGDLVDRFQDWADRFAGGRAADCGPHAEESPDPTDGAMTPE